MFKNNNISGLFHRVILQSGNALDPWATSPTHKKNSFTVSLALNCPAGSMFSFNSQIFLNCLQNVPAEQLGEAILDLQVSIIHKFLNL